MNKTTLATLGASALLGLSADAQNLLVNGSFETGTFINNGDGCQTLLPGSTLMTGWTVTIDQIARCRNGNAYGITASQGTMLLDFTGYDNLVPHGGVMQTAATSVGQLYQLSFDLGVNPDQPIYRGPITVMATAGSSSMSFIHNPTGMGTQWGTYGFQFTADNASTPITIVGLSGDSFIGLDNVALVAVPEPSTIALLGIGAFGLLLRMKRK